MGQVLCPEKDRKSTGVQGSTVAHTHRGRESRGAGRTHTPQPQHYADAPQAGQARHRAHHRTGAQHHTEAQHTEENTREYTRVHRGVL